MRAVVLVQVEQQYRSDLTAENLRILPGVQTAFRVTGPYDIIVDVSALEMEELSEKVGRIQATAGITRTITMIVLPPVE